MTRNLIGQKFGRWTVQAVAAKRGSKLAWRCICDCGQSRDVIGENLVSGKSLSCGCLTSERPRTTYAHSKADIPLELWSTHRSEIHAWYGMFRRCDNPADKKYPEYGGRGIGICDRWRHGADGKSGLACFLEDMGPRPGPKHSLDRKNNDLGYEPSNCRWATKLTQTENKRDARQLTYGGRTQSLKAWAVEFGLTAPALRYRLDVNKMPIERALTMPHRKGRRQKPP